MAEAQFGRDTLWLGGFSPRYIGPGMFFVSAVFFVLHFKQMSAMVRQFFEKIRLVMD